MMSVQNPYSLVNRIYEIGMSEISIREKCGLLAYYPLASGALSGKYRNNQMPKNTRLTLFKGWERFLNPLAKKAYDEYYKLSKEYNLKLSLRRANAVRKIFTKYGIENSQIRILGKGEDFLAIKTDDEVKHPANRRAEIITSN